MLKRKSMKSSEWRRISPVSSRRRLPSCPTGPIWTCTMHRQAGPLVWIRLLLSPYPLHPLASFHGNNGDGERERETNRKREMVEKEKKPQRVSSLTPVGACFIRLVTVSALRETNRSLNFPLIWFHHLSSITLITACQPVDLLGPWLWNRSF